MTPPRPLRARLIGEIPVYALALVGLAVCLLLWRAHGVSFGMGSALVSGELMLASMTLFGLVMMVRGLRRDRPASPFAWLRVRAAEGSLARQVVAALPLLLLCIVVAPVFSNLKSMIPLFTDYTWDATFIAADRALFLGHDPWRVLQPLIGYPIVTATIAFLYHLWFLFLYPGVVFFGTARVVDEGLRRQFFLTYLASWILVGGALATALASVGPIFVGPLLGDPTFAALHRYLAAADAQVPVMVLDVQKMLLENFAKDARGLGSGITAMPSMHIAICVLYWLAGRRLSRRAGRALAAFGLVIWIGSIHTGYHYALDGIVSLAVMVPLWGAAGLVVRGWDRWLARRAQADLRTNTVPAE